MKFLGDCFVKGAGVFLFFAFKFALHLFVKWLDHVDCVPCAFLKDEEVHIAAIGLSKAYDRD